MDHIHIFQEVCTLHTLVCVAPVILSISMMEQVTEFYYKATHFVKYNNINGNCTFSPGDNVRAHFRMFFLANSSVGTFSATILIYEAIMNLCNS